MRRFIYPDFEKCAFQPSQDLLQKILRQIAVLVGCHPFGPLEIVAIPMFNTSGRRAALQKHLSPPLHTASVEPAAVYYYILMSFREWLADHTNHILRTRMLSMRKIQGIRLVAMVVQYKERVQHEGYRQSKSEANMATMIMCWPRGLAAMDFLTF